MTGPWDKETRVLSVDPHPRGFGYAVFEGPLRFVDWGTKDVRVDKERVALHKIGELVQLYRPTVIAVEDYGHRKSRRNPRVRQLTGSILAAAREFGAEGRTLPLAAVYRAFAGTGAGTKYGIATALVRAFPELMVRLPPKRKPWQSEDSRMSIFDAVALGLTYFRTLRRTETARAPDGYSRNADHHACRSASEGRLLPFRRGPSSPNRTLKREYYGTINASRPQRHNQTQPRRTESRSDAGRNSHAPPGATL